MSEEYLKEVTLPSKGFLYDGQVPDGLVSVEPMGTREEKLFASSSNRGQKILNKIFESCVACPIPHNKLVLGDRLFLLLTLRSISYGDTYNFPFRCSECKEKVYEDLNISQLAIRYATEDSALFSVDLPILKNSVSLRLLTGEDEEKIHQYVESLKRSKIKDRDGADMVYRLARRIEELDGSPIGIKEAMQFVETLKGADVVALRNAIDDHDVGPEVELECECSNCGFLNGPLILPFETEFFRPRRRSTSSNDYLRTAEDLDDADSRDNVR